MALTRPRVSKEEFLSLLDDIRRERNKAGIPLRDQNPLSNVFWSLINAPLQATGKGIIIASSQSVWSRPLGSGEQSQPRPSIGIQKVH